jgi:hypothetical protein
MNHRIRAAVGGVLLVLASIGLRAHDEIPRPVAELVLTPAGERLDVTAHLPIAALTEVKLPRGNDGHILRDNLEQPLQIVAQDLAASLELQQDGVPLPMPTMQATLTPDDGFVDVELGYLIRAGVGNLAARVRTYRAGGNPVAVVARYVIAPGVSRTFTVADRSERVTFDPDTTTAMTHFVGRGARTLLDNWDVVLFVICLVVPFRAPRARRSALLVMLAAETLAAASTAAGWPALQPSVLPGVMAVAASAIVVVSLQAIVSPASGWLPPLSLLFGLANGAALGHTFRDALPYAGSHQFASFGVLIVVVLLVQLWVIVLLSAATGLLFRWGVPERIAVLATSAVVCHTALDLLIERSTVLAQLSAITAEHFLMALTLAWVLIVLAAGFRSANGTDGPDPQRLPQPARARS